jgi:hypothetical protein
MASIYEKEPMRKAAAQQKARAAMVLYDVPSHCSDRTKYVKSGKKLSAETIKSLMEYFQLLFAQKKADGSLERAELDRIRQRATRTLASSRREQRNAQRSRHARGELSERERRDGGRSYRRIDDDGGNYRDGRDRRGEKIAYQHDGGDYRDDVIAVAKISPIDATDAMDAANAAIATTSRTADAAQEAETADIAAEATIGARARQKRPANNAPLNAATARAAPTPVATERGWSPTTRTSSTGATHR